MSDSQQELLITNFKSKVGTGVDNPNEGKPLLNEQDEYVLSLVKIPHVKPFNEIVDGKDGSKKTVAKQKAICEFREEKTGNIVVAFWRVDYLNFTDDEKFESGIIRFFRKIGNPITPEPDETIAWGKYFLQGMRFRSRVVVGKDTDKKPNGKYYIDVPTCRRILESDMHPEAVAASIESIALLIKGATDERDATLRLYDAKQSAEVIQRFLVAVKSGVITFPVK